MKTICYISYNKTKFTLSFVRLAQKDGEACDIATNCEIVRKFVMFPRHIME